MDPKSVALIFDLLIDGVGVAMEIRDLAKRVKNGEEITDDEIKSARAEIDSAVSDWFDEESGA